MRNHSTKFLVQKDLNKRMKEYLEDLNVRARDRFLLQEGAGKVYSNIKYLVTCLEYSGTGSKPSGNRLAWDGSRNNPEVDPRAGS